MKFIYRLLTFLFILVIYSSVYCQNGSYRIMFYNTENLFDTKDDTLKNDEEFLPESDRHWDNHKFYKKLNNTAKVIIGVGGWQAPAIVGLCEIENRFVLNQLVYETPLKNFGYRIIHRESPDWRGIDVAMLYRKEYFTPDTFIIIPVRFPFDTVSRTRDILYVKGCFQNSEPLHFFFNHWPSRYGGYLQTKPKREFTAGLLRHKVDSLFQTDTKTKIIIMGDFNDGPNDESILTVLRAEPEMIPDSVSILVNLMYPYDKDKTVGTLKYHESWDVFDQVIVSQSLLEALGGWKVDDTGAHIYQAKFLITGDERYYGVQPFRTYKGFEYQGGFSDHLPLYIDLIDAAGN